MRDFSRLDRLIQGFVEKGTNPGCAVAIMQGDNHSELYFEENDIEAFVEKLESLYPNTEYVNRLMTHRWGQKVIRFYDLDGNLIEVGTPM